MPMGSSGIRMSEKMIAASTPRRATVTDAPTEASRRVAGVLDRFPGHFQQQALLIEEEVGDGDAEMPQRLRRQLGQSAHFAIAGRTGRRPSRAGDADDPRRELGLHHLADRAARTEGHDGRQVPRHVAALRGRARGHAPRHRRAVRPLCAAAVARRQRLPQPAHDEPPHPRAIAEAHLGLGRMDVHIDILRRQVEEQRQHRMAIARQHIGIGPAHRADQQPVLHRTAVDEEILVLAAWTIERRQAGEAAQLAELRHHAHAGAPQEGPRVARATALQRFADKPWQLNSQIPSRELRTTYKPERAAMNFLHDELDRELITARGLHKIIRTSWSFADLHGHPVPTMSDVQAAHTMRGKVEA